MYNLIKNYKQETPLTFYNPISQDYNNQANSSYHINRPKISYEDKKVDYSIM